jgi:ketosteroid isomerase-like protein
VSQENVEVIGRIYAATEQGNFQVAEFFDPDVHIVWLEAVGTETETVGLEAMANKMRNWLGAYKDVTLTAERLVDAGDQVVALAVWHAQGRTSGVATEWHHGSVWTLEGGKVTSLSSYEDRDDALRAAGLSEQ